MLSPSLVWRPLTLACLLALLLGQPLSVARAASTTAAATASAASDRYAGVQPSLRSAIAARTKATLSRYTMDVTLDPAASTIGGDAQVVYRNDAPVALGEVWFRLFPNADYYGDGGTDVRDMTVDGAPATPALGVAGTALRVPLPQPVAPDGSVTIAFRFTTTVPADSHGSFGIFSHDTATGTWVLADWHPVLAVYQQDGGWSLPAPTPAGDPTFAASALYDVTIHAPNGLRVVAPGAETDLPGGDGIAVHRFVAGPAREFTVVADDDYASASRDAGGVTIAVWTQPAVDAAVRQQTLDVAARALGLYDQRFGAYPFTRLDIVDVRLDQALGISWTGLIFLDGAGMFAQMAKSNPVGFATVLSHEVSHLWWGATVGADSNAHAYLNEGLATISSLFYQEQTAGVDVARQQLNAWVIGPARSLLHSGDAVVDLPETANENEDIRAWAVYGKASVGFLAIRNAIGDAAFWAGLHDYATRFQFGIPGPNDLRAAWERASGKNLDALWSQWFDQTDLTQQQIDAVVAAFAPGG
ncbi:MAG TPA: M1 family metallopeptidase [Thermomicrobiales bacterium]|nr:M1 family metallopeptidase [Thermomicrobiales bacterium]